MSLFPVLPVLPFRTSQAIATSYKCYLSTVVSEKKRSFVIEGNRLLAWAVLPRFCREYSEEALREMRNRSCACGRLPFLSSPLQLLVPVSRSARFAYLPETRRRYSSHVLDPGRRRFTVSNKLFSPSLSLFLFLFFSSSFFPSSGLLVCPWTDAALVKREFQDFQIALRSLETLLENSEERTFFRSFCIETSCRSVLCIYIFLVE